MSKLSLLGLLLLACGSSGSALRVEETKTVIEEPTDWVDLETGINAPPYIFELPHVVGGAPGVADKMNETLRFRDFSRWLGTTFDVPFRRGPYIAIRIIKSPFCGAYCEPSESDEWLFDTRTGELVHSEELFSSDRLDELTERLEAIRMANVERALAAMEAQERDLFSEETRSGTFTRARLGSQLAFSDSGITFPTSYDYPHYAQALEPESPSLTWAELEPYLTPAHRDLAKR